MFRRSARVSGSLRESRDVALHGSDGRIRRPVSG
jgi:hypothetical protein